MKYFLLIAFAALCLSPFKSTAQDMSKADYFKAVKTAKNDSLRMVALLNLGYTVYSGNKPDSAIYYYNQAYAIAQRIKNTKGILRYYACYGDILSARSKNYEAITMAQKAVALAESSENDHYKGAAYNNIAGCYTDVSNIEKANEYYLKAIAAYERLNDKKHLSAVYANILGVYFSMGHSPDKALKYGLKTIEMSREIHDDYVLEEALSNVSAVYLSMGNQQKALSNLYESMAVSRKLNDKIYLTNELVALCNILTLQRKYNELPKYTKQIAQLSQESGSKQGLAHAEYYNALAFFEARNYSSARQHVTQSLALSKQFAIGDLEESSYSTLADIELVAGNVSAYHQNRYLEDSLRDKLHSEQLIRNNQELETKYNVSKKEAEIKDLNKEKQIQQLTLQKRTSYMLAAFFTVLALLVVGWLVYKNSIRKEKLLISERELKEQQIQVLEKEKELLSAQALMKGQEAERSRLAKDLHDGLGGILTGTKFSLSSMKQNMIISAENAAAFEKTMTMLDQSITELRRVAHNMMPESLLKLSLDDALQDYCQQITDSGALRVTYQSFDLEELSNDESVKIAVYRIVQELINNVVKHAEADSAIVQIALKEHELGITIEDDGKGFIVNNLSFATGIGYKNLKSRVDFLKGSIDVKSEPGQGTSVFIKLAV